MQGEQVEKLELQQDIFDGKVNDALLYQAVLMYRANRRRGSASTKRRAEVKGGGRKPWRQKGTGRARVGSIRSPLWRGGGVTFGPQPRDYSYSLPRRALREALRSSLNSKLKDNNLVLIDEIKLNRPKTKEFVSILSNLKVESSSLLVVLDSLDTNIIRSSQNISYLTAKRADNINSYEVLSHQKVIVTKAALKNLTERLSKRGS